MTSLPPPLKPASARRVANRRNAVLVLYGLSAFSGLREIVAPQNSLLYLAISIAAATFATIWFMNDRQLLSMSRLPILEMLFFFTWPVAALIHLLATRGVRGLGYWLLNAVGLYAIYLLVLLPTALLLAWMGFLDLEPFVEP